MEKIDKIIEIIKYLKEDGMSLASGQIAGTVEAGDDPPVRKRKKYMSGGRGSRKLWMQYLKNK
jgi:hypothetical protein